MYGITASGTCAICPSPRGCHCACSFCYVALVEAEREAERAAEDVRRETCSVCLVRGQRGTEIVSWAGDYYCVAACIPEGPDPWEE